MPRKTFKLRTTSIELLDKVNPENMKLVKRFLKEKKTRSSELTIKNYESDLNIFLTWNLQNNDDKFFIDIRKLEFSDFFSFGVDEMKWGSARFSRMKSVLSSFSNFIERFYDEEYKNFKNVILRAVESMPKNIRREKTILTEQQVKSLFNYIETELKDAQIACWLALAIGSGSRFAELLRFTIDNIDENNTAFEDIFLETLKPIKTKGRGSEGKMLYKYIIKDIFLPYYKKWLPIREAILKNNNIEHNYVFIKDDGNVITEVVVRGWIKKIEDFLEIPFYAHSLRHYFTTYLSSHGIPHELIKEIVGWANLDMVFLYDDVSAKDKRWKELEKFKKTLNSEEE